ncbi:hypothetical protein KORDIASMS9_03499 [Kordia sp. SMS9]|uniref:hypothetical protein n=1 Tax=Kordia sp. SMS9 TaxID=2282170 RepID=UPI000E10DAF4|nr:hypothetical protein [Kordia sp. SMS9]AXG71242.1 hypothetical protein KORDIASMS9_03499 [Kordia sp. SMS9]
MKYYVTILCITSVFFLGLFLDFPLWLLITLNMLIFATLLFWELSVFTNKFKGDFALKSYKKSLDLLKYLGLFMFVFLVFEKSSWNDLSTFEMSILFFAVAIVSADIIVYSLYKLKHPATIFIHNDEFIFNNCWLKKRNLKNLNYIGISPLAGELVLGFIKKRDVLLPFREYDKKEFRAFLEILVEKSEHNVYLTEKVQNKFPATSLERTV